MGNVKHKGSLEKNSREGGGVAEEKLGRGHGEHIVSEGASRAWAWSEHGLGGFGAEE